MLSESAARTFRNSVQDARFVIFYWILALVWTLGYCLSRGYIHGDDSRWVRNGLATPGVPAQVRTMFGLPSWVFWGIIAPWLCCSVLTVLYGLFGMQDDDLGIEQEGDSHGA